jgi:RND family efflux transporter MFP subunit
MKKFLVVVALVACADAPTVRHETHAPAITTPPARVIPVEPTFVGVIVAGEIFDLAPRFEGVVSAIRVRVGDSVAAGEVVAELDPRSLREHVRAATAALAAARAAARQAEVDVEDAVRRLAVETNAVATGISPQVLVDEAQIAVARARAAFDRASSTVSAEASRVQSARDQLADAVLRAPSAGVIAMRFKDPGTTVTAGTAIVRIVSRGAPRLRFAVPAETARTLAPETELDAEVETIVAPIAARVRQVSPTLDASSGLVIVEAELSREDIATALRPGLAVRVRVGSPRVRTACGPACAHEVPGDNVLK